MKKDKKLTLDRDIAVQLPHANHGMNCSKKELPHSCWVHPVYSNSVRNDIWLLDALWSCWTKLFVQNSPAGMICTANCFLLLFRNLPPLTQNNPVRSLNHLLVSNSLKSQTKPSDLPPQYISQLRLLCWNPYLCSQLRLQSSSPALTFRSLPILKRQ